MKKLLIAMLCALLLAGCSNDSNDIPKFGEDTAEDTSQAESEQDVDIDNSGNDADVPFEKIENALQEAFQGMDALNTNF